MLCSWFYRIRPAVTHLPFEEAPEGSSGLRQEGLSPEGITTPNQLRWIPRDFPAAGTKVDWAQGLNTMTYHGDPTAQSGIQVHMYSCNADMVDKGFCNADGDFLIVPQAPARRSRQCAERRFRCACRRIR